MVESITVNVPAHAAYGQWSQLHTLPKFMGGVRSVEEYPNGLTHWVIDIGGVKREFDAEVLDAEADLRVAWASIDGPRHSGTVEFEPLDESATRVTAEVDIDPEGFVENAADKLGVLNMRLRHDLKRFKDYMERPVDETGGTAS